LGVRTYDATAGNGVPVNEYYGGRQLRNHAPVGVNLIPVPSDVADEDFVSREGKCQDISARTNAPCEGDAKKTGEYAGQLCVGHANRARARAKREASS
jgi:hypothetical protein